MKRTDIEWTATALPDGTTEPGLSSNPLQYRDATGRVVWACVKCSSGCANCYAEQIAERFDRGGPYTRAAMAGLAPFLDDKEVKHILGAKTIGGKPVAGSRCFLGDMTDVFGDWVPDELLDRLFAVMALRPDVTFQILTKRPERMARYFADGHRNGRGTHTSVFIAREMGRLADEHGIDSSELDEVNGLGDSWPPNVWAGTSCENQAAADARIPHLLATPAAVRFLSCEPLLDEVDLRHVGKTLRGDDIDALLGWRIRYGYKPRNPSEGGLSVSMARDESLGKIDWVIVGGESGPGARPFQLDWARSIQNQCDATGVPWFMKQTGSNAHDWDRGDAPNHVPPELVQLRLKDKKGGDLSELPSALRVREFPT
jgi:protein gp37